MVDEGTEQTDMLPQVSQPEAKTQTDSTVNQKAQVEEAVKTFKKRRGTSFEELQKEPDWQPTEENKAMAKDILEKGNPWQFILETTQAVHVGDVQAIALLELSGVSPSIGDRQLVLHSNSIGKSTKGKSHAMDTVKHVFPWTVTITSLSAKAIFYAKKAGRLRPKCILIIDEADSSKDAIPIERTLTSRDRTLPNNWTVDDNKNFQELVVDDVLVIWRNSVDPPEDDQLNNRYLHYNADESPEQDSRVFDKQKEAYGLGVNLALPKEFEIAKTINYLVLNSPIRVIIPFIDAINFPMISNRRNFPAFVSLIIAAATLFYEQRVRIGNYILASKEDFDIALWIWRAIQRQQHLHVSESALKVLEQLPVEQDTHITRAELASKLHMTTNGIKKQLDKLIDADLANDEKIERTYHYWKSGSELTEPNLNEAKFTPETVSIALNKAGVNQKHRSCEELTMLLWQSRFVGGTDVKTLFMDKKLEAPYLLNEVPAPMVFGSIGSLIKDSNNVGRFDVNSEQLTTSSAGSTTQTMPTPSELLKLVFTDLEPEHNEINLKLRICRLGGVEQVAAEELIEHWRNKGEISAPKPHCFRRSGA